MNMNLKSILTIMAISASTAVMSVWGYGKFVERQTAGIRESGKLPVNYAGYFGTTMRQRQPLILRRQLPVLHLP